MAGTEHRFDPVILREYDIRGVVGETLGAADARAAEVSRHAARLQIDATEGKHWTQTALDAICKAAPSLEADTRKQLDAAEVDGYASNLMEAIRGLLLEENLEIRPNSEWLGALSMTDVLELTSKFTVSRIMDRDDFSKRWAANQPISLIEFMYPLLQALDSVDIQTGDRVGDNDSIIIERNPSL